MEWLDGLTDEELKGNEGLKKFENVDALAKSYINIESMQGNSLRIPSEEATVEDRAKFYNKIIERAPELMLRPNPDSTEQMEEYYRMTGVPENDEGYKYEGTDFDADTINELRKLAVKHKFTKTQWKGYIEDMTEMSGATMQMREDTRTRMGAELKTEWGMAFEDRFAVVEQHLSERPAMGGIADYSPEQIKVLYADAIALVGKPQAFKQPDSQNSMSPSEAKEQIAEIDGNPVRHSYSPADRPEQQRLMKKRIELMRKAYPEKYG